MGKEMVEIMEIREDLNNLKTSTKEELDKISKKLKDSKLDNKKMIESKFEEILDTVNFSVNNNPNIFTGEGKSVDKIIDSKMTEYEKSKEDEIAELTSVVEEIADKLVEDNKQMKTKIKELEKKSSASNLGGLEEAVLNTNKLVKILEKDVKQEIDKEKEKVLEIKEKQENNLDKIENLEAQLNELVQKINNNDTNELSEQMVILEKKTQGERLELQEDIKNIKEQVNNLKDRIINENEINGLIDLKFDNFKISDEYEEQIKSLKEQVVELNKAQTDIIEELQQEVSKQSEKVDKIDNKIETKIPTKRIDELKNQFNELKQVQEEQKEKFGQVEGIQISQTEKIKEIAENKAKIEEIGNKLQNIENEQTIKAEELNQVNEKSKEHGEKIETLIALMQEQEKQLELNDEKIKQFDETIKANEKIVKNAKTSKKEVLEEIKTTYGKQVDNFEDRINLLEKNQSEQETKFGTVQTELIDIIETFKNEQEEIQKGTSEKLNVLEKATKKLNEKQQNYAVSLNFLNKNIETYNEEKTKNVEELQNKIAELEELTKAQEDVVAAKITGIQEQVLQVETGNQNVQTETSEMFKKLEQKIENTVKNQQLKIEDLQNLNKEQETKVENKVSALEERVENKMTALEEKMSEVNKEKLDDVIQKQSENARKIKNLAIAMEERLEVYENTSQAPIEELNKNVEAHNEKIETLQNKVEELNKNIKKETEENYNKMQAENEELLETKIKDMQNRSNKVFTQQFNKIKTENKTLITEQMQDVNTQVSQIINEELEKIKQDNAKMMNEKITRMQIQNEVELEKKVRKIKAEYDKKLKEMQQVLNNFMRENAKESTTRRKTSGTTPVFAYEPVEDISSYNKNLYKKIQSQQIKNVAQNIDDDSDDTDIINFFDVDDE